MFTIPDNNPIPGSSSQGVLTSIALPRQIALAVLMVGFFAACSNANNNQQPATSKQSTDPNNLENLVPVTLRIHAWTGYAEPLEAAFRSHMRQSGYEVSLEIQPASGLESFTTALQSNTADLISPAHDLTRTFITRDLVQPLAAEALPNLRQVNPVIHKRLSLSPDVIPYIAPITFGPYALAYRRDAFATPPTSYRILWDPAHRGSVSIADYDTANIYMTALMLGIPKTDLFTLNADQLAAIEKELALLHQQNQPRYWGDNLPIEEADNLSIGTDWGVGVQHINMKSPKKWAITIPTEGATAWVDSWMLNKACEGDTKIVAHAFINFSLEAKMQAEIARATSYGVTNMYASRHMTPEELDRYNLSDGEYLTKLILWQPLTAEHMEAYQALWKRVTE